VNFRLPSEHGKIALLDSRLTTIDCVLYGSQRPGISVGRCPNGGATVQNQVLATPGAPNFCSGSTQPPQLVPLITVILLLTYYVKVSDLKDQLATVSAKEAGLKETFKSKSYEAANLDAYKAQMAEMNKTFDKLLSRLPQKTEIAGLLEDIGAKGRESGLTIYSLGIKPEVVAEYYIEVPIGINVKGGYHDLGGFVSGVAGLPRIVTLHDFSISRSGKGQQLEMDILAKTYRYKAVDTSVKKQSSAKKKRKK
jgi:type IV pilus assembly protein PilO